MAKSLVKIPGYDIKAQAEGKTLFSAVENLEKKLEGQLKKNKEKKTINKNKMGGKSKNLLRKIFKQ